MDKFPWLKTGDSLPLGVGVHFSSTSRYMLMETQLAYGMKAPNVITASITRWMSHDTGCERICDRGTVKFDALDDIISKNPKPGLIGYRSKLLDSKILLQIPFLEGELSITNTFSLVVLVQKNVLES